MSKTAALWSATQATQATGGEARGEWCADGISIDSRTLSPGDLFVALKGSNHDGHDHVGAAISAQAAAAIVERVPDNLTAPLLIVPDTLQGLVALARAARARSQARIIAVTGSVGKTGTKDMIARALATSGKVTFSAGNLNNHIGAPLSLARLTEDSSFGVFELGMNHAGEIAPLSRLLRPHVVLVTNVEAVHMEFFPDVSNIAEAKAEIFNGVESGAIAVLNHDNAHFELLCERARKAGISRIITFGHGEDCDARLLAHSPSEEGSEIEADIDGTRLSYRIGLSGAHWALNSVAALAVVHAVGAPIIAASKALAAQTALPGRGARFQLGLSNGSYTVIDESYNASPVAVAAAISNLRNTEPGPGGRRIAVLGDMLELGKSSPIAHAALANDLTAANIDLVFTAGSLMAHLFAALPETLQGGQAKNSTELLPLIVAAVKPGDVVLVKGSLGLKMRLLVDGLKRAGDAAGSNG